MKEIAVFYRNRENQLTIRYLQENIYGIFGEYVNVSNYYTNELSSIGKINADAYLLCYEESFQDLFGHIDDFSKVVVMTRSIQHKYLRPVIDIPAHTEVLVVNDSKESTLQTIYMIYELGIGHLRLIPYEESADISEEYNRLNYAIIAQGSEHMVPKHIQNVYNIHNREISFDTFRRLISVLGLENSFVHHNLMRKIKEDLDTSTDYINNYIGSFLKDQMFKNIINDETLAIVLLDRNNKVQFINEKAFFIFNIEQGELFPIAQLFDKPISEIPSFSNEVIIYNETTYVVEKVDLSLMDEMVGFYITLKEEQYFRETENKLSRKLKETGFIAHNTFDDIIHVSEVMKQCISVGKKAASSGYTVLIRGESGTGKELMAQSIHNYSSRRNYPFVAVNCAAIPESLLDSELFGYEEGSFTGAHKGGKPGLFEHAQHGTIFLDEIGDISPGLQTRLLRVIQEKQIMRIGSGKVIDVDVRMIAATNADLEERVSKGLFRRDLFYRLNVIPLQLAPLRQRREDILPLLKFFLGKDFSNLTPKDIDASLNYHWPGNIRELENAALYFKTMNQLPEHIASHGHDGIDSETISKPIDNDLSDNLPVLILTIMCKNTSTYSGIGRGQLLRLLTANGIVIGEGTLKRILANLKQQGYIETHAGRAGSHVTSKGRTLINL